MVENGIIIPSSYVPSNSKHSGWSFPIRYVPKKGGQLRLATQFMKLNEVTIRDTWPLPSMIDILESFGGSKWFSALDLLKGFHQI